MCVCVCGGGGLVLSFDACNNSLSHKIRYITNADVIQRFNC